MTDRVPPAPHEEEAASIYGRAGVVAFFTLLSRILGLARDLVIAHRFGAGAATDAWVQAFRLPNALRRLTAEGSATIAFVPIYVDVREKQGHDAAIRFSRRVLGIVLLATGALVALGMVFNSELALVASPGFVSDAGKFDLTAALIRWTFPYLLLVSLVAWAMGVLNSEGRYAAPAAAPILLNVGNIVGVLGFSDGFEHPIMAVAAGVLAGGAAQVLLQFPSLLASGAKPWPLLGWGDPAVRRLFGLLVPALLSVSVYQINLIVLGIIASFLPTGQIFDFNNATRLTELVLGLFAFAFTTAGLPALSRHMARGDWARTSEVARLTFSAVLFTILPAMAGLIGAAPAIVAMLYLRGEFGYADVLITADTLRVLALGMPAVAAVRVMVPIFYALKDARTPALVSLAALFVTAGLGWWFSRYWEVRGLALGLTAGSWFNCLLLGLTLRARADRLSGWFSLRAAGLQAGAAAAMGVLAYWATGLGEWQVGGQSAWNWTLFTGTVLGAGGFYLAVTLVASEPESRRWLHLLNRGLARIGRWGQRS